MMGYGFNQCFGSGGGWMMMGGMFLFWIVLLALLVFSFIMMQKSWRPQKDQNNAIDILKIRLAKGEITEEEFERLLQKLK